jgi:hypothetical protein
VGVLSLSASILIEVRVDSVAFLLSLMASFDSPPAAANTTTLCGGSGPRIQTSKCRHVLLRRYFNQMKRWDKQEN